MKYITSKGLLYSTKDCIQYLLVTNNGKESEKEYLYLSIQTKIYIYIKRNHFVITWNTTLKINYISIKTLHQGGKKASREESINFIKFKKKRVQTPESFQAWLCPWGRESWWIQPTLVYLLIHQVLTNVKECSNYRTVALISHASKVMLKTLQANLQWYEN